MKFTNCFTPRPQLFSKICSEYHNPQTMYDYSWCKVMHGLWITVLRLQDESVHACAIYYIIIPTHTLSNLYSCSRISFTSAFLFAVFSWVNCSLMVVIACLRWFENTMQNIMVVLTKSPSVTSVVVHSDGMHHVIIHDRLQLWVTSTITTMYCFHSALYCQSLASHDFMLAAVR